MSGNSGVTAVILCGGLGTRLRPVVNDVPKPMAKIKGKPFLEILVSYLIKNGVTNIVFSTGYGAEVIETHFRGLHGLNAELIFSREAKRLGTAGAVKLAEKVIKTSEFVVLNGDTLCAVNLMDTVGYHHKKNADVTVVVTDKVNTGDTGNILMDNDNRIIRFIEKQAPVSKKNKTFVNAGIYVMNKSVLNMIPVDTEFSFEHGVFPKLEGIYGYITDQTFIDIGTPERYKFANEVIKV
ncbi:MAG: sugar phosphate nucleotidyltransferase [Elusimicrobiota bacterium]